MKTNKLQCPCCTLFKDQQEVQVLLDQFRSMKRKVLKNAEVTIDFNFIYSLLESGWKQWACDACFKNEKAIASDPTQINYTVSPKYLAYFDKKIECHTCKEEFIFSAKEQQYWFEVLRFWHDSYPTKCPTCRKNIRQQKALHKELSDLLINLDKDNPDQLQKIAEIYEELVITEKAKLYNTLARKKDQTKNNTQINKLFSA